MLLLKLGGSVVTDKSSYATFKENSTRRLIGELKLGLEGLRDDRAILVHGAGSFGHILAREHSINRGNGGGGDHLNIVPRIRRDMRKLNFFIEELLIEKIFHPISISPETILRKEGEDIIKPIPQAIAGLLTFIREGFLPVLYGDIVADDDIGFSICSGDDVMNVLSHIDEIDRIIFVTAVDGIFSANIDGTRGGLIRESSSSSILGEISISTDDEIADVTGSMYGKAKRIADIASRTDVLVINGNIPGRLESAIRGESVTGTLIRS